MDALTPIPAKVWVLANGSFDLPEDEEFDAFQATRMPPVGAGWPFDTVHYTDHYADGQQKDHWCIRGPEGKWLEIADKD
jgi:hypothetical protein